MNGKPGSKRAQSMQYRSNYPLQIGREQRKRGYESQDGNGKQPVWGEAIRMQGRNREGKYNIKLVGCVRESYSRQQEEF